MNDKKNLYLFTYNFPFEDGEAYLETEIKYLSQSFDKILVISMSRKHKVISDLPKNVKAINFNSNLNVEFSTYLKAILNRDFFIELYNIKYLYHLKLKKDLIIELLYFIIMGNRLYDFTFKIINSDNSKAKKYIYSYWFNYFSYAALQLKRRIKNLRAFTRTHSGDLYFERDSNNYLPLRKVILKGLDKIFFISLDGMNYFKEKNKININSVYRNKLLLSRLGVDNLFLKKYRIHDDKLRIVTCSTVLKIKRLDLLIEALSNIDEYELEWIHFGTGKDLKKIKNMADRKLSENINIKYTFMGNVKNENIYKYYQSEIIDLFINVSKFEGIPVSIMEACSFGIPIIATDVGGNREIVSSKNGILLPSNPSSYELKEAINKFYFSNKNRKIEMSINSYKIFKSLYCGNKNYTNFVRQILKL